MLDFLRFFRFSYFHLRFSRDWNLGLSFSMKLVIVISFSWQCFSTPPPPGPVAAEVEKSVSLRLGLGYKWKRSAFSFGRGRRDVDVFRLPPVLSTLRKFWDFFWDGDGEFLGGVSLSQVTLVLKEVVDVRVEPRRRPFWLGLPFTSPRPPPSLLNDVGW